MNFLQLSLRNVKGISTCYWKSSNIMHSLSNFLIISQTPTIRCISRKVKHISVFIYVDSEQLTNGHDKTLCCLQSIPRRKILLWLLLKGNDIGFLVFSSSYPIANWWLHSPTYLRISWVLSSAASSRSYTCCHGL